MSRSVLSPERLQGGLGLGGGGLGLGGGTQVKFGARPLHGAAAQARLVLAKLRIRIILAPGDILCILSYKIFADLHDLIC